MIEITFDVTLAKWMLTPTRRWNAGLKRAGLNFVGELKDYPPKPSTSDYKRTGTMRKKVNYQIVREGLEMHFGSVFYTKFALFGTGIFGPRRAPITPVRARFMHWVGQSGTHYRARSVKGYIWEGKADKIKVKMIEGFKAGVREFKE